MSYDEGEIISKSVSDSMGKVNFKLPSWVTKDAKVPEHIKNLKAEQISLPWWRKQKWAVVIRDVYTKEECADLVKMAEDLGFEDALVNIGYGEQKKMELIRNNKRVMIDTFEFADHLYQRVKDFIPPIWNQRERVSLNERLRFLRYHKGEYFAPHFDGEYRRKNGERSYITILFYLNDGFEGGNTTFLDMNGKQKYEVQLSAGMVLLFQHDILHEGSILRDGVKYCLRSDVMYSQYVTDKVKCEELNAKWEEDQKKRITVKKIEDSSSDEKTET